MAERDNVGYQRELVDDRVGDVVGCVEADNGGEEGPGAESASGESVDGGWSGVDAGGVFLGVVGLEGVESCDDGGLGGVGD